MNAATRHLSAGLTLVLSAAAAAQIPLVSVPEDPADHTANPRAPIPPQPLPAAALFDYDPALPLRFTVVGGQSRDNLRLVDATFVEGDRILTEISAKFTEERIDAELSAAGFATDARWTDDAGWFAVTLATRR